MNQRGIRMAEQNAEVSREPQTSAGAHGCHPEQPDETVILGPRLQLAVDHEQPPAPGAQVSGDLGHRGEVAEERAPLAMRITVLLAVVIPFLGTIAAIALLWGNGFSWLQLGLLVVMYHLTMLGVTVGFHRLFTHRSFETSRSIQVILGIMGSMAVQGPLLKWVAVHRRHHQLSDKCGDPHSPHLHGSGVLGALHGMWHAHVGWLFEPDGPDLHRYIPDLMPDRALRVVSKLFALWVTIGLLLPAVAGGLLTGTWWGALLGFIWGGLVRVFLVHHAAWSVNSICHLWGGRPFRSHDESRNNVVFGLLGMGEGWHNNHHAFPTSARHGLRWWQVDLTYMVIRGLSALGLAWKVRVPSPEILASRRRDVARTQPQGASSGLQSPASG